MDTAATPAPAEAAPAFTPEQATARRSELMADAAWRTSAFSGAGPAWDELSSLNAAIAAGMPPDDEEGFEQQDAPLPEEFELDGDIPADAFAPPATPRDYDLPLTLAMANNLPLDHVAEAELRDALHQGGIDRHFAQLAYTAAIQGAMQQRSAVDEAGARAVAEQGLRAKWGASYAANLEAAKGEARRMFAALPQSITGGADFETWVETAGLGNNHVLIEQLAMRARHRARGK